MSPNSVRLVAGRLPGQVIATITWDGLYRSKSEQEWQQGIGWRFNTLATPLVTGWSFPWAAGPNELDAWIMESAHYLGAWDLIRETRTDRQTESEILGRKPVLMLTEGTLVNAGFPLSTLLASPCVTTWLFRPVYGTLRSADHGDSSLDKEGRRLDSLHGVTPIPVQERPERVRYQLGPERRRDKRG